MQVVKSLFAALSLAAPGSAISQSNLLTALEGSSPAPTGGVSVLWGDPTADPRATGVLFGVNRASYASVRVFHAALGFRLGPRWGLAIASADMGDLFDSSLTNQDPGLSSLRARAVLGHLDATFTLPRVTASLGIGLAGNDNVGAFESSTIARARVRIHPLRSDDLTIGMQAAQPVGGSVPRSDGGLRSIDLTARRALGRSALLATVSAVQGCLWRYSETRGGYAGAVQVTFLSQLDLGVSLGRYRTSYGASLAEWRRSIGAALRVGSLRLGIRYSSTQLGFGSGFALSLGYEPTTTTRAQRPPDTNSANLSR